MSFEVRKTPILHELRHVNGSPHPQEDMMEVSATLDAVRKKGEKGCGVPHTVPTPMSAGVTTAVTIAEITICVSEHSENTDMLKENFQTMYI